MPDQISELLTKPLVAINLGIDGFAQSLERQGVEVVRVDWKPPAGGDQALISILDQLL